MDGKVVCWFGRVFETLALQKGVLEAEIEVVKGKRMKEEEEEETIKCNC